MASSVTIKPAVTTQALGNIRPLASRVRVLPDGTDLAGQIRDSSASSALAHAQEQDQIDKLFMLWRGGITITAADIASLLSASTPIQYVNLVAATTTDITPAVAATIGASLVVVITQDSSGTGQITWDVAGGTVRWCPVDIGMLPNLVAQFRLIGRNDPVDNVVRWFLDGLPLIEQTP